MNAPRRIFTAEPAVRGHSPLLIGIMAPSGGGKTYSALRLATGIQRVQGGDIYGIDTEKRRMRDCADYFKFKHVPFEPPFGSLDYLDVIRWVNQQGSRITIVDSMTHEHIGEGGYLETAEAVVTRIAGNDWKKREACKMLGWATAGPARQKMIEGIKQLDGAFIFCFRAKEKVKPVRRGDKTEILDMGFMPIAGEEWIYEMSVNCMLEPRANGVPKWRSDMIGERSMMKLPLQFKDIFRDGEPLSEDIGEKLARWAAGEPASARPAERPAPSPAISATEDSRARFIEATRDHIKRATDYQKLGEWWNSAEQKQARRDFELTTEHVNELTAFTTARLATLKPKAAEADQAAVKEMQG